MRCSTVQFPTLYSAAFYASICDGSAFQVLWQPLATGVHTNVTENISWSHAFSFTNVLLILDVFAYQAKTPTAPHPSSPRLFFWELWGRETHRNEGEGSYLKLKWQFLVNPYFTNTFPQPVLHRAFQSVQLAPMIINDSLIQCRHNLGQLMGITAKKCLIFKSNNAPILYNNFGNRRTVSFSHPLTNVICTAFTVEVILAISDAKSTN